ncbi:MAG: caspase family protein [Bosea sp. (in: a-proteobacteria)]|uniref:caspase family protein n=1 Tax=Bosea sp. (in: a-proteobacteria) TaxID=1871050 RepID=UPI0027373CFB|nr:caspase family protein [Bosea sp. (in: a-proteobacteria)]MDP3256075.1 caspase family protein [Bosea sp. (in: a-proteobacteria)]MDP3321182.1 caspase family protein [Bosea sp. (in: a-proteobacteria)]
MRVCICVGCNNYDHEQNLNGAEGDAQNVFRLLTSVEYGDYDPTTSKLVLSPSASELKDALVSCLYDCGPIDVITFVFAGHGVVAHETFYLALRDTDSRRLSLTGYSFSEIVRAVVSINPKQANFVIDACNSGGVGYDLSTILRGSLVGNSGTVGVSLLAAAASDETAWEGDSGGAFTNELVRAISGKAHVNAHSPYLDLGEIGSVITPKTPGNEKQTVSRWALNVQGPGRFVRNPHFCTGPNTNPIIDLSEQMSLKLSENDVAKIKKISSSLTEAIDERHIFEFLLQITKDIPPDHGAAILQGLHVSLVAEAQRSTDPFAAARVSSCFVACMGHLSATSSLARANLALMIDSLVNSDYVAILSLSDQIRINEFALLRNGLPDLFALPIRISDILGRIGSVALSDRIDSDQISNLRDISEKIIDIYGNSLLSVSEDQATNIFVFIVASYHNGWIEIAEQVICRMFIDLVNNHGRVTPANVLPSDIPKLLAERYSIKSNLDEFFYENPSDLSSVIILLGALGGIDEAIDYELIRIDLLNINIHCPETPFSIFRRSPMPGQNLTLTIGERIWRCIDIRRAWEFDIKPLLLGSTDDIVPDVWFSMLHVSLSYRDRIPWVFAARTLKFESGPLRKVSVDDGTVIWPNTGS